MRHTILMLLAAVVAVPVSAQQRDVRLQPGDTVRVSLNDRSRHRAVVTGVDGSSYVLRTAGRGDTVLSMAPNIVRLERFDGRRSRLSNAGWGALWAASIGAVSGALIGAISWDPDGLLSADTRGGEAAFFAVAFGILSAPVGALVGVAMPIERWRDATRSAPSQTAAGPTFRAAPTRDGFAITLSYAVR